MTSFVPLPIVNGFGPYTVNRFRVAFKADRLDAITLASRFITNFPSYVKSSFATVERVGATHYSFTGAVPIKGLSKLPNPHRDWVEVISLNNLCRFTVRTLLRTSFSAEDALFIPLDIIPGFSPSDENRHHFLAGRRAWRLDEATIFNTPAHAPFEPGQFVLETAAVERYSTPFYAKLDGLFAPAVIGVWTNLLGNFVNNNGLQVLTGPQWPIEPNWVPDHSTGYEVHRFRGDFTTASAMYASPEFNLLRRQPSDTRGSVCPYGPLYPQLCD